MADGPAESGLQARRLAVAVADQQLSDGYDVVIGQYLARTAFIEELEELATRHGAEFIETVLTLSVAELIARLTERRTHPTRAEHHANNQLVGPDDAAGLIASLAALSHLRPRTRAIDASGSLEEVVDRFSAWLPRPSNRPPTGSG